MALVFNDRVKETSTTTGTGTLNLGGAFQDFQTFVAGIGNSNETYYNIVLPQTGEFEVGRGVVTDASPDTLSRLEVFTSSNNNNLVDFSAGTKTVFCTLPANKFVPGKFEGTNFTNSILIGHATTGTLSNAERNTGVGIEALDAVTIGDNNTIVGYVSGTDLTSGIGNTGVGAYSITNITNATDCTGVGLSSLFTNISGIENTAVGSKSLFKTSGSYNTALGKSAGQEIAGGTYNIVIGNVAGDNITSGSGNVIIGSVDAASATGDRQLKIAGHDGSSTTNWISGDSSGNLTFPADLTVDTNTLHVDSSNNRVGIGTTSPVQRLHLHNSGTGSGDHAYMQFTTGDTGSTGSDGLTVGVAANNAAYVYSREASRPLYIQSKGSVQLATGSSITNRLELKENGNIVINESGEATDFRIEGDSEQNLFFVDGSADKIGIGTTSPSTLLHLSSADPQITITDTDGTGSQVIKAVTDDLTIDVVGQINLDADSNGLVTINDGGTQVGSFFKTASTFSIKSDVQDKRLEIKGNDGGSEVTAVAFHMANAGQANFNDKIVLNANKVIEFGDSGETISGDGTDLTITSSGVINTSSTQFKINGSSLSPVVLSSQGVQFATLQKENDGDLVIRSLTSDKDIVLRGNDGGSQIDAFKLDMSEAGAATFNDKIILGANKSIEFGDAGETITGDGTNLTILSSGYMEVKSTGNLLLDSTNGSIFLRDTTLNLLQVFKSGTTDTILKQPLSDGDLTIRGNDGGSDVDALIFDMSEAGDATFNSNIFLGDNKKANFGAGNDLQIYHDGSQSIIEDAGTGQLKILAENTLFFGSTTGSEKYISAVKNGKVDLSHDNAVKLETTSTGIDITGTAVTDGLTVAGNVSVDSGTIKLDGNYPTGTNNVALGDTALDSIGNGGAGHNVAIGHAALTADDTGTGNVGIGAFALTATVTGNYNTAIGQEALKANTSSENNAIGYQSMLTSYSGEKNVALGFWTLKNLGNNDKNVAIGHKAGLNLTGGDNNIIVGHNAQAASATTSNQITLGDANITSLRIPGLQSGASSGDVLTFDGTDIGFATPTGVSAGFAVAMAIAL
jgi:hypothetical protein